MPTRELLIGLDDTDNLYSRGTGYRARCLARGLEQAGLGSVTGVTRHQLLVHDAIPYTSHNSSACLGTLSTQDIDISALIEFCRSFLRETAAEGSDVGLCIAAHSAAAKTREFGFLAQRRVLERFEAEKLALAENIFLEGLTGTHQGKIGALAAVALHSYGDDGRYIWVKGIRELEEQTLRLDELHHRTGVEMIMTLAGAVVTDPEVMISLGPWPRPVRVSGKATLLVEENNGADARWKVVGKDIIKAFRP